MAGRQKDPEELVSRHTPTSRISEDDPRFVHISRGRSRRKDIPIPRPSPHWMPQARSWFNSLKLSGQSELFEASDWATAVAAAQAYDIFLRSHNGSIFANFVKLSERLGCTITDRKRARIELTDADASDADETEADAAVLGWHGRLQVVPDDE